MIEDHKQIVINALPDRVFDLIVTMPNKFPVYKILETRPFFFIRVLLVDGWRSAVEAVRFERPAESLVLQVGDSMGPFRLTEMEKPLYYRFILRSFFFNCRTGYSLSRCGNMTTLCFDLVVEDPGIFERIWWFFVKPVHGLLAGKVLKVIKAKAEAVPVLVP